MGLVRTLRKHNTKIMAGVVIVLMIAFVGGTYIQQFSRRTGRPTETVAFYGQDKKISHNDVMLAQRELEILKTIRADGILRSQDLRAMFLGELLFPEHSMSVEIIAKIEELVKSNAYRISEKQIDDIYRPSMSAGTYWLLLKKETEDAGFIIPKDETGKVFASLAPQLFQGAPYQQVMASLMKQGIAEDEVLSAFSSLLAVLQYARISCSNENLTASQIMHDVSRDEEKMNVQTVRFDSALFEKGVPEPNPQQIQTQFDKFKAFFASDINDSNPYGFGYKQHARVQLEFLALKLDDVAKIITPPTNQDMEDYYQKHIEDFTVSYHSDPNDPNSPVIKKPRGYGEVAGIISRILSHERINTKAEGILHQAKETTETRLQTADTEIAKLTSEQFKQLSSDYEPVAKQLGEKNGIKIYTGKTGLLSAVDMQSDEQLRMAYVSSFKLNPVPLAKVAFAANDLGVSELGPFDPPKPRLYENIGPVRNNEKKTMMLVRVIEAKNSSVPENIDLTFSIAPVMINSDTNSAEQKVYSLRNNISDDLRKLAAMDIARAKAGEFIEAVKKDGWDAAIAKFNKLYPSKDAKEPNAFKLQNLADLQRLSKSMLRTLAAEDIGDPVAQTILLQAKQQHLLLENLYSLVPPDSDTATNLPAILEFKPNLSFYCIKNLTVTRINANDFEKAKAKAVFREDFAQSQAMAAVFFNPDNIVKRMNFRWTKKEIRPMLPEEMPIPDGDF